MLETAVAAFIGAFAAVLVIGEIQMASKVLKYLVALLAGTLLTIVLALILGWMLHLLGQVHVG